MPHRIKTASEALQPAFTRNLAACRSRRGYHLIIYDIRPITHSTNQKHEQLIFS
jgi:hypothetical protein